MDICEQPISILELGETNKKMTNAMEAVQLFNCRGFRNLKKDHLRTGMYVLSYHPR